MRKSTATAAQEEGIAMKLNVVLRIKGSSGLDKKIEDAVRVIREFRKTYPTSTSEVYIDMEHTPNPTDVHIE